MLKNLPKLTVITSKNTFIERNVGLSPKVGSVDSLQLNEFNFQSRCTAYVESVDESTNKIRIRYTLSVKKNNIFNIDVYYVETTL